MSDLECAPPGRRHRGERNARLSVALATSAAYPNLDDDSVPLLAALARHGVEAQPAIWSDPAIDWSAYDAVLVRSTWDYCDRLEEFLAWAHGVPVPMFNPRAVLAWNAHKAYLRDLEERGVPTVDTLWVEAGQTEEAPWAEAVVKPAVAASARGLRRARGGDRIEADEDLLVQPLLPSIRTEGEYSLLYAAGELSHAVRKTPRQGDIRVQSEWGGSTVFVDAGGEAEAVASAAMAAVEGELLYARVDLVRAPDGTLRLIELELIEPSLFLLGNPEGTERFARAFSAAFARSS